MAPSLTEVQARIERLSEERQALWAGVIPSKDSVDALSKKLADAFEEKRSCFASAGTPEKKAKVIRRARVEHELERLIDSSKGESRSPGSRTPALVLA